jgi:hypothetical protein
VLNHQIPVYRIYVLSMGDAPIAGQPAVTESHGSASARVEVSVMKNDLMISTQH